MPILVDIRKLTIIGKLIQHGATNVASSLSTMAGIEADVQIKSLSFVQPEDISTEMGEGEMYHASIRLTEPPYGVFVMTFDDHTAATIAEQMTGQKVDGDLNQMHQSALQEICNILTSGFIDGIANTLETTIDMETPTLERDHTDDIAEQTVSHIQMDSLSIVLDSLVDLAEQDTEFKLRIFLIPDPGSFVNLIDKLDIDEIRDKDNLADVYDGEGAF
jgi:chemotaxis protein CheC